jgi:hypothetical protein
MAAVILLGAVGLLAAAGLRNGDRPGDARVSARSRPGGRDGEPGPVLSAVVRNPSGAVVLAGLRARRAWLPAGLAGPQSAGAPLLTRRRAFRPGRLGAVGAVPAGGAAELTVPAPPRGRRWLLTVIVGQQGGRLRVYRLRVDSRGGLAPRRDALSSRSTLP